MRASPVGPASIVLIQSSAALVLIGMAQSAPDAYSLLVEEDRWVEWATFLAYLLSAGIAIDGAVRRRPPDALGRAALAGLGLACLFFAGEEIAWGQRLIGFLPPRAFRLGSPEMELEVHALLGAWIDERALVGWVALVYAGVAPLLAWLQLWPRALAAHVSLAPWGFAVAAIEYFQPVRLAGETAELVLGLTVLADVVMRRHGDERLAGAGRAALAQAAALAFAAAMPIATRPLQRRDPDLARSARAEIDLLAEDLARAGVLQPGLLGRSRAHKRLFTAVRDRFVRFGGTSAFLDHWRPVAETTRYYSRQDRRGWLLDPWNRPYWILWERDSGGNGRLLVYSLGPDGRSDSAPARLDLPVERVLGGDDLGRIVAIR